MTADKNWFDPNTYIEMMKTADMTKMFEGASVPGFDTEAVTEAQKKNVQAFVCLLYTSPSPRDRTRSRMPSSA